MVDDASPHTVARWIYWSTVLAVGSATIYGLAQYIETPGRGGTGWFYALIWLPALFGGIALGAVIGVLARAFAPKPHAGRPRDEPRRHVRSAALRTGAFCAAGFLVIAGSILLADRLVRPAEVSSGSAQAVLLLLLPAIPVGLISALGTVALPVGIESPARMRRKAMLGAGIGAAVVGGAPLGLVPSATFSFAAAIPFGLGFPIAFALLFVLAIGCAGFRLRERLSR